MSDQEHIANDGKDSRSVKKNDAAKSRRSGGLSAAELIAKLSREEERVASGMILAPVMQGDTRVRVRVAGLVYQLKLKPTDETGWLLLKITAPGEAEYVQHADQKQVSSYLKLFPRVRLIALENFRDNWWCIPAQRQDSRFQVDSAVPVLMPQRLASFDVFYARFDGTRFFYEAPDRRHNPSLASRLRKQLQDNVSPASLQISGALPSEKDAYRMLYLLKNPDLRVSARVPNSGDETRDRIEGSLAHAGAQLDTYWHLNPELVTVRFRLDGAVRTATVNSADLTLVSAGVCLSGQDSMFDLSSLVGVLREYGGEDYD